MGVIHVQSGFFLHKSPIFVIEFYNTQGIQNMYVCLYHTPCDNVSSGKISLVICLNLCGEINKHFLPCKLKKYKSKEMYIWIKTVSLKQSKS